jgi:hypothetical protein
VVAALVGDVPVVVALVGDVPVVAALVGDVPVVAALVVPVVVALVGAPRVTVLLVPQLASGRPIATTKSHRCALTAHFIGAHDTSPRTATPQ